MDRLRAAAGLAVEASSHAELGRVGAALAGAMQSVGLGNWGRFVARAEARAVEAVSRGEVPGVVKASAESAGIGLGAAVLLFLGTLYWAGRTAEHGGTPSPEAGGIVRQEKPDEATKPHTDPKPDGAASQHPATPAGSAIVTDERRQHILDGDKTGGGHRPGTGKPGKPSSRPTGQMIRLSRRSKRLPMIRSRIGRLEAMAQQLLKECVMAWKSE